jgi:hypothetical protein
MAKTNQYCVAENWGEGFIEHSESAKISFRGLPGNVWQLPANNKDANLWIHKVLGTVKTKDEAQEIVNTDIAAQQARWDAFTDNEKSDIERPVDIVLED